MRVSLKEVKKLPVETLSGDVIGHIIDIVFDAEEQFIRQYVVKSGTLRSSLYTISRDQIVSFQEDKVVVYDTAVPREQREKKKETPVVISPPEGVAAQEDAA